MMDMLVDYGWVGLLLVSAAEAAFLPFVTPELILIPLMLAEPRLGFWYATLAVIGSLLGALFGYWIGSKAGQPLLRKIMSEASTKKMRRALKRYGLWVVGVASLTPLPLKLFTITSGVFHLRRGRLLLGVLIGRVVRFFAVVLVVRRIGVVHLPEGLETKLLVILLAIGGLAGLFYYLRSQHGVWLRESSAEIVFVLIGALCSVLVALFGGLTVAEALLPFDGQLLQHASLLGGSAVAVLLWLLGGVATKQLCPPEREACS